MAQEEAGKDLGDGFAGAKLEGSPLVMLLCVRKGALVEQVDPPQADVAPAVQRMRLCGVSYFDPRRVQHSLGHNNEKPSALPLKHVFFDEVTLVVVAEQSDYAQSHLVKSPAP